MGRKNILDTPPTESTISHCSHTIRRPNHQGIMLSSASLGICSRHHHHALHWRRTTTMGCRFEAHEGIRPALS